MKTKSSFELLNTPVKQYTHKSTSLDFFHWIKINKDIIQYELLLYVLYVFLPIVMLDFSERTGSYIMLSFMEMSSVATGRKVKSQTVQGC